MNESAEDGCNGEQPCSQALRKQVEELKKLLELERFANRTLKKRLLFLGTHCDALSLLLTGQRQ